MPSLQHTQRSPRQLKNNRLTQKRPARPNTIKKVAEHAFEAVQRGQYSSINQACKALALVTGMKADSIRKAQYRLAVGAAAAKKEHGHRLLTDVQEKVVVGVILGFASASVPLTSTRIVTAIEAAFHVHVSLSFITEFKKRHSRELGTASAKGLETRRIKVATPGLVQDWLRRLHAFLRVRHFPSHARLNVDETRLTAAYRTKRVVAKKGATTVDKNNARESRLRCLGTLVPFITAAGTVFQSHYVLKNKNGKWRGVVPIEERRRGSWPRKFLFSPSGFVSKVQWTIIMNDFADLWKSINPSLDCCIFLDNCSVHRSDNVEDVDANLILQMASKGIWLFFLPPNTTHWLQPLDDSAFGTLKLVLGRQHEDLCFSAAIHSDSDGRMILDDVVRAEAASFTKSTIERSWRATGLSASNDPTTVDEKLIMQRARHTYGLMGTTARTVAHHAQAAALGVIKSTPVRKPKRESTLTVSSTRSYYAGELARLALAAQQAADDKKAAAEQARQQAAEQEKQRLEEKMAQQQTRAEAKRAAVEANRCRGCNKVFRQGKNWAECSHCTKYSMCGPCWKSKKKLMDNHEKECRKKKSK